METSPGLQNKVIVNGDHGDVTSQARASTPTAGLSGSKGKQKSEDILKYINKSNPPGTMNGGKPTEEDIENCTPPHSPAVTNKAVESLRKEPRAKMTLSPNKAAAEASAASTVTVKHGTARKTLNSASSAAISIDRNKPPNNIVAELIAASETKSSAASSDSEIYETTSCTSSSDETSQSPSQCPPSWAKGRRARKCMPSRKHKSAVSLGKESMPASKPKANSIANMTLQLCEIEKTLGIKTLNDIDAKTLDKLILEKARLPRRESKSRTASPDVSRGASPSVDNVTKSNMVSILKNNNVLASTPKPEKVVPNTGSPSVEEKPVEESEPEVTTGAEVKMEPLSASPGKQATQQKKRRRKRTGNYDLPKIGNRSKKLKSAVTGVKTKQYSSVGLKKEPDTKPTKARPKPVIAMAVKPAMDDSYETVEELDLTQSPVKSSQVSNGDVAPTTPSTPVLQSRRKEGRAVIGGKATRSCSNSPVPLPKTPQSQSKPVLGLKKTPAAVSEPVEKANGEAKASPAQKKPKKAAKPKTEAQSGSEVDSPRDIVINPKTNKPYIRGPYKNRVKVKGELDSSAGTSQSQDTSFETAPEASETEKSVTESSSANKTIPILEKFTKKLNNPKNTLDSSLSSVESDNPTSTSNVSPNKKRPKGWAAAALAKSKVNKKRRLIQVVKSSPNRGKMTISNVLFKKKLKASPAKVKLSSTKLGTSKLTAKPANKPTNTSPKDSAAANSKALKNQRSVLDMFTELKRRRSSLQLPVKKPEVDATKKEAMEVENPEPTVNTAATQVEDEEVGMSI